ncbi:MAG: hypothetical protein M3N47_08355 [Chloroflexota bacterium]|nr:hypothetical protein [Chloroflexota bacterium]
MTLKDETVEVGAGNVVIVPAGAAYRFVSSGDDVVRLVTHPHGDVVTQPTGGER